MLCNGQDLGPPVSDGAVNQNCTPLVSAPSTTRFVPVIKLAAGLARNTTARAISSGRPMLPAGFRAIARANRSGLPCSIFSQTPPAKYVFPGDTALTLMLRPASWYDRPFA